jgi:hypothetical protein
MGGLIALAVAVLSGGQVAAVKTVPAGAVLDLLLQTPLDSATARINDRFEAATIADYRIQDRVVLASGSLARGFVGSLKTSKPKLEAQLTLAFEDMQVGGRAARLRATVTAVLDSKLQRPTRQLDPSVAVAEVNRPAPIVGLFVAPEGSIQSKQGADVKLPVGTIIRIRLDQPLEVPDAP